MNTNSEISKALKDEGFFLSQDEVLDLGWALYQSGCYSEALQLITPSIEGSSDTPQAYLLASSCYQALLKWDKAEKCACEALSLEPSLPEALNLLGEIMEGTGSDENAVISLFQKAASLNPKFVNPILNIGNVYWRRGAIDDSLEYFRRAVELAPRRFEACYNYARALQQKGMAREALDFYAKALALRKGNVESLWNMSICHLLLGEYSQGWSKYGYRNDLSSGSVLYACPKLPLWRGFDEPGHCNGPVLLVAEQGFGDTIQFIRYIRYLSERGVIIRLCAQSQLHDLIIASGLHPSPVSPDDCNAITDGFWLPLLSLPGLLGVTPENVIFSDPYIKPLRQHFRKWRKLLSCESLPVVGIHWQGNHQLESSNESFRGRSFALEEFKPVVLNNRIKVLSLQKGFGSEQVRECSFSDAFVDCQASIDQTWGFLETLAIIANCDLVITSDSAVAHLAGALGKTTWLLLMSVPEWRWGLESSQTFWYPSVRIFRQKEEGNWAQLMQDVACALKIDLSESVSLRRSREFAGGYGSSFQIQLRKCTVLFERFLAHFWSWVENDLEQASVGGGPQSADHREVGSTLSESYGDQFRIQRDLSCLAKKILPIGVAQDVARVEDLVRVVLRAGHPSLFHSMGMLWLRRGEVDHAIFYFRYSLKTSYAFPQAYASLAFCWRLKRRLVRARGLYRVAVASGFETSAVLSDYASLLRELGDSDAASEIDGRLSVLSLSSEEA